MNKQVLIVCLSLLPFSLFSQTNHLENQISIQKKELSISGNGFNTLPKIILQLDYLEELSITSTEIKKIPNEISFLSNSLNTLLIEYNKSLEGISDSIGLLRELNQLSIIDSEKVVMIPSSIGSLTKLTSLRIARTSIVAIPDSIGNCVNLVELNLSNNLLTDLPISLGNCKQIKVLILSNNPFTEIPACLAYLTNLQRLEIKNTQLSLGQRELLKTIISCAITE